MVEVMAAGRRRRVVVVVVVQKATERATVALSMQLLHHLGLTSFMAAMSDKGKRSA